MAPRFGSPGGGIAIAPRRRGSHYGIPDSGSDFRGSKGGKGSKGSKGGKGSSTGGCAQCPPNIVDTAVSL